nr:MAG TPA: Regulatory protein repA [Caudoviricetes sp.]
MRWKILNDMRERRYKSISDDDFIKFRNEYYYGSNIEIEYTKVNIDNFNAYYDMFIKLAAVNAYYKLGFVDRDLFDPCAGYIDGTLVDEQESIDELNRLLSNSLDDIHKHFEHLFEDANNISDCNDLIPRASSDLDADEERKPIWYFEEGQAGIFNIREAEKIIGASKNGKSTYALELCMRIANGLDVQWMRDDGKIITSHTKETPVLYVDFEMTRPQLQARIDNIAAVHKIDYKNEIDTFSVLGCNRPHTWREIKNMIKRWVRQHPDSLVVLDPWSKILSKVTNGASENDSNAAYQVFAEFDEIIAEGCCLTYVIHSSAKSDKKEDTLSAGNNVRGSSAHGDYGATAIYIETAKKKDERTMSLTYRDLSDGGAKYTFHIINGVYVPKPLSANPKTRMFSTDEKKTINKINELIGDKDRVKDTVLETHDIKLSKKVIRELGFDVNGHYVYRKD